MTRKALLIVDVQNDFVEGGSLAVAGGKGVALAIAQNLIPSDAYAVVVASRDMHIDPGSHFSTNPDYVDTWPVHCHKGTGGEDLVTCVESAMSGRFMDDPVATAIVDKGHFTAAYSAFEGYYSEIANAWEDKISTEDECSSGDLAEHFDLYDITEVDVVGLAYDHCVKASALDCVKYGFKTNVLCDYTAAVSGVTAASATEQLTGAGVSLVGQVRPVAG